MHGQYLFSGQWWSFNNYIQFLSQMISSFYLLAISDLILLITDLCFVTCLFVPGNKRRKKWWELSTPYDVRFALMFSSSFNFFHIRNQQIECNQLTLYGEKGLAFAISVWYEIRDPWNLKLQIRESYPNQKIFSNSLLLDDLDNYHPAFIALRRHQ